MKKTLIYGAILTVALFFGVNKTFADVNVSANSVASTSHLSAVSSSNVNIEGSSNSSNSSSAGSSASSSSVASASATGGNASVEVDVDRDHNNNDKDHDKNHRNDRRDKSGRKLPATGSNGVVLFAIVSIALISSVFGIKKYLVNAK